MERSFYLRIAAIFCCFLFIYFLTVSMVVNAVFAEGLVLGGTVAATEAALTETSTVAIGSAGLTDQLRSAADAAGQDVQAWVNDRIAAYNSVASGSTLLPLMAVDLMRSLAYTPDGELIFSKQFADAFASFMDWMIDEGDIVLPAADLSQVASGNINFISYPISVYSANKVFWQRTSSMYTIVVSSHDCKFSFCMDSRNRVSCVIASESAFSYGYGAHGNSSTNPAMTFTSVTANSNGKTFYWAAVGSDCTNIDYLTSSISVSYDALFQSGYGDKVAYDMLYGATSTGATDGIDVWNDADDGVVIDPTALLGDAIAGLQGAIANVGDYIGTLADVIAGVQNPALPVVGVGDIPITIPSDITIPVNPAIPGERVDDVPATGENSDSPYMGTGDYTLPLADFFPFCIPFDIYEMLSLLAASPVAPVIDYPFPIPGGGTYTVHIDLSEFDTVAQVLRTMETLAFCVGLGFATKKLLFGS